MKTVDLSTERQQPQEVDYQNLERLWGQEINQIPVPVREIIAGALRKIREDNYSKTSSDYFYCTCPLPSTLSEFPVI
jgi:hypothetical protein